MRTENSKFYKECHLAGAKYHELFEVINEIKVGDSVELEPEPDNKFDPNAVAVIYNKTLADGASSISYMIGYIPSSENQEIANILNMGWNIFSAKISMVSPDEANYEQKVRLVIRIKKNAAD